MYMGVIIIILGHTATTTRVNALSLASSVGTFSQTAGQSALKQVEWLGTRVVQSEKEQEYEQETGYFNDDEILGTSRPAAQAARELRRLEAMRKKESPFKERQVWQALANLEKDSTYIYIFAAGAAAAGAAFSEDKTTWK
jgi:hypothetical protein